MASDSPALALWGYLLFGGKLVSQQSLLAMTDFGNGVYGLGVFNQTKNNAWRGGAKRSATEDGMTAAMRRLSSSYRTQGLSSPS